MSEFNINSNQLSKNSTDLSKVSFNFNFSFFRNFLKNMHKYLHIVSLDKSAFYSLLTFIKVLNNKECDIFYDQILERVLILSTKGHKEIDSKSLDFKSYKDIEEVLYLKMDTLTSILTEIIEYE